MAWSKWADWLPLSNAEAQVNFWEEDLRQAQMYLSTIRSYRRFNFKFFRKVLRIAILDVSLSRRELRKAREKLVRTRKRVLRSR